jgi:hypothetical protein
MSCIQMYYDSTFVYRTLVMPRLSYYVNEETHSTFVFMILVMPRLPYYVSEDTHIVHLYTGHW